LPRFSGGGIVNGVVVWSFVASVYGFIVALPPGAVIRQRGLQSGAGIAQLVYVGNLIGAAGALIGTIALLWLAAGRVLFG